MMLCVVTLTLTLISDQAAIIRTSLLMYSIVISSPDRLPVYMLFVSSDSHGCLERQRPAPRWRRRSRLDRQAAKRLKEFACGLNPITDNFRIPKDMTADRMLTNRDSYPMRLYVDSFTLRLRGTVKVVKETVNIMERARSSGIRDGTGNAAVLETKTSHPAYPGCHGGV
ncbi:hypothetical protein FRC15_006449 [Serendipita sp. 397]|nr:hypothetical protein FRC15_006449 [Serendipita sp. 397]